jgi:hypothetical protein
MSVEQAFSGMIDHFGLATTEGDYILKLHESSTTPHPKGSEDATDEDGNMVDRGYYVTGPGTPVECVYKLVSGTLDMSDLDPLGKGTGKVIASASMNPTNGDWPTLTVTGILYASVPATLPTFTWPALTFTGTKKAQLPGFNAVGGDVRLTGATYEMAGEIHHVLGDKDTVANIAFTGALLTVSADVIRISGAPVVTPTAEGPIEDAEVTQAAGGTAGITSWTTGTFGAELHLTPDVA